MRGTTIVGGAAAAGLLLIAGACGGAEPEGSTLIPPGRYHYRAAHPIPDANDSIRLEGVLRITFAEGDSLAGRWEVERMHPELRAAPAENGGVEIRGQPTYFGSIVNEITRSGGGFECAGRYTWVAESGGEQSLPMTCALASDVPPGLVTPAPGATTIRPIDEDTVPR